MGQTEVQVGDNFDNPSYASQAKCPALRSGRRVLLLRMKFPEAPLWHLAEGAGRLSGHVAEADAEMLRVGKSAAVPNFLHWHIRGEHQMLGPLDAMHLKEFDR
jgi:hypothetical protein